MLGEKIGGTAGKITSQRILPNLGGDPKMETSFQANGSILGTDVKETGTYCTIVRPDGTLYGEGQGVMMLKENGDLDGPWRRLDEERRDRELSRCRLLSNFAPKMGSAEQGRSRVRIRGRRRGQHTLRILGMEVNMVWFLDAEAFHRNALQHLCFIRVNLWLRNLRDLPAVQAGTPDGE